MGFSNSKCTKVECVDCPSSNGPCHGISEVLSNGNKNAKLSEHASDKNMVKCFDTSAVTDMYWFLKTYSINADLSSWDVSSVTTMQGMFHQASAFNGDISSWDVSSVTMMQSMFYKARIFNNDISSWDVSVVTEMYQMFKSAIRYEQKMCEWNLEGKSAYQMFINSQCTEAECVEC